MCSYKIEIKLHLTKGQRSNEAQRYRYKYGYKLIERGCADISSVSVID